MNHRSIRFRLIAWYAGVLLLVMLGFGAFTYANLDRYMTQVLRETLSHRSEQIEEMISSAEAKADETYVGREIKNRYDPELNDKFVRVTRGDTVTYVSGSPNDHSFVPWEVPRWEGKEKTASSHIAITSAGDRLLVATRRVYTEKGDYLVEVGASTANGQQILHTLLITLLAGLSVVLVAVTLGGLYLMKRALQPVQQVMFAAQDISLYHLSRRLPELASGDEIANLTSVLNQMIARLDESFQHTVRFTADASHELRTPLTIIRGELESMLFRQGLAGETKESIEELLEEVERLGRIVENLFSLSRLDTGEAQSHRVRLDLAELVESTADQMSLLAEDKDIDVVCETLTPVEVEGDQTRLKQVVVNLLDNAVKYTPEGGKVQLIVSAENGSALLQVSDNGPGVPEAALPHIFERFYRADEARSRTIDGAGLGLSIVRSICLAHGGTVTASNHQPSGCCFTVRLPRIH